MAEYAIAEVIELFDVQEAAPAGVDLEEARAAVRSGDPARVAALQGPFAVVATEGRRVFLARSLDRPLRYFLGKAVAGPFLLVSDRIDAIQRWLVADGKGDQFRPEYTRMVPAHYVLTLDLLGCPDPLPTLDRWFAPPRDALPADLDAIGAAYVSAAAAEIDAWLDRVPADEPLGVLFSGGADSGGVLLLVDHLLRARGQAPQRLKAFCLDGGGDDVAQARAFLAAVGREHLLETIPVPAGGVDMDAVLRCVEDYKALDVESAAMGWTLLAGIRERYPSWRYLLDGDGGDENLKDYPVEENHELTIRSVLSNSMLYHEGWGAESIKHSLTYSGGYSRGCVRSYAPAREHGFELFSPLLQRSVITVSEAIPFVALTDWQLDRLYALKGEVVKRGVAAVTGDDMPVYPKRRFQQGALPEQTFDAAGRAAREADYRARVRLHFA